MELPERIAAIIKVNQHTAASFADALGIQRSNISHILNGRNKPSLDLLEKILNHFPRVDAAWLITGKAPAKPIEAEEPSQFVAKPLVQAKREAQQAAMESSAPNSGGGADSGQDKVIERIVVFYTDRTFATYEPQQDQSRGIS